MTGDGPDLVYVLGPGGDEELRYSLRSVAAHLPHRRVWVAGRRPDWVRGVGHVPVPQARTKFENSTANLRAAAEHGGVSEGFVYLNDDFFVLAAVERVPVLHAGPAPVPAPRPARPGRRPARHASYREGMAATVALLAGWGIGPVLSYDLHVPMPMTKTLLLEALEAAQGSGIVALHKRTLYGNLHAIGGERAADCKIAARSGVWPDGAVFASTTNRSFTHGEAGRRIRGMFAEPCRYEQGGA